MIPAYLRMTRFTISLCLFLPVFVYSGSMLNTGAKSVEFWVNSALFAALASGLSLTTSRMLRYYASTIEGQSTEEAEFIDGLPARWIPLAIAASAAGSLALELAIIRWQGTVWETFAFYKNFSLLACFAGLGLGYALSGKNRVPTVMVLPLLAFQVIFLLMLRYAMPAELLGSLRSTPIIEQLNMGANIAKGRILVAVYYFLSTVMLLTALAFIPIGQLCGRLLGRTTPLCAYGFNLLGSIAGVMLMMALSSLWTPPVVWFIPCFAVLILLQAFQLRVTLVGLISALIAIVALDWPVSIMSERIYSPYQLIERGPGEHGLTTIQASGHYYQKILDLSLEAQNAFGELRSQARYYEMPSRLHPKLGKVAVVGAGTGNDVAAALRMGAEHVDAIEIDPVIMQVGRFYHPERPYDDGRVTCVINDARTYLRRTKNQYDLIVYGLLDSHTLLSHASSVRIDSFVYTVEGLRDARNRLNEDGVVSLSFCVLSPEIGRKIYLMMEEAFGKPPVCIWAQYDGSVIFAQSKRGDLRLDPDILKGVDFEDRSAMYANPDIKTDVSTDDWPFFYMPKRIYPSSYIYMLVLIVILCAFLYGNFAQEWPRFSNFAYFFMGAGFMLVETKGITELGLMFGNTWRLIGIVIVAILLMAYLANLVAAMLQLRRPTVPLLLLLASLGFGLAIMKWGGFPATTPGQLAAVVVLTCPMFFSGIAFSSLLAATEDISAALAMNLLGAMCGGLLEYNSMYFGFQFLYWLAMAIYTGALISSMAVRYMK